MAKKSSRPKRLPKEFKKYFWDVDFKDLSLAKYSDFIIGRITTLGDIKALKWLLQIPKKEILRIMGASREIDAKTRNFWKVVYGG